MKQLVCVCVHNKGSFNPNSLVHCKDCQTTCANILLTGGDFGGIDFSKLGGAGGMPDLGDLSSMMGGGLGGDEGEDEGEDDEDDEELPALEGEEATKKD